MAFARFSRKLKQILTVSTLVVTAVALATTLTPTTDTTHTYSDNVGILDTVPSANGSYLYVVGSIMRHDPLDPNKHPTDVYVAKYTTGGSLVQECYWDGPVGAASDPDGTGNDQATSVTLDADGCVIVTGSAGSDDNSYSRLFVLRFDPSSISSGPVASYIYTNPVGNRFDSGVSVAAASEGGSYDRIYVTGNLGMNSGNPDVITMKLRHSLASAHWTTTFSSTAAESGVKVVPNYDGGQMRVYVAGQQGAKALVIRYNASGTEDWHTAWDYENDNWGTNVVTGLAVQPNGVDGVYISSTSSRWSPGNNNDIVAVRFDKSTGALDADSGWNDSTWRSTSDPESTSAGIVIDPSTHEPIIGGSVGYGTGGAWSDYALIRWTSDLSAYYTPQFFGANDNWSTGQDSWEVATKVALDGDSRIYIAGHSTPHDNVEVGPTGVPGFESPNVFIVAADRSTFSEAWRYLGGASKSIVDLPYRVAVTSAGNVFAINITDDSPVVGDWLDFRYLHDPSY